MVDMAMIGGISNSLNIALNISKAMLGIRDQALMQEKVLELTSEIISAQQAAIAAITTQTALTERIRELEKHVADLETWETEKQRYELKTIARGATVYAVKENARGSEPPHWICTACYQNGKKSILQTAGAATQSGPDFRMNKWRCPRCNSEIRVPMLTSPTHPSHESEM